MFIKHHKKWVALLTAFAFIWLIQIGNLPLQAETTAPTTSISADQQPGAIEQAAPAGYAHKKSSPIIPIIIGVVVVGAVAAVLILVVFKTKYDITGQWTVLREGYTRYMTFTGTKKSGTLTIGFTGYSDPDADTGIYTVDGKNVNFTQQDSWWNDYQYRYIGSFTTKNTMSGTFSMDYGYPESGTWTATRTSAASFQPVVVQAAGPKVNDRNRTK